MIRLLFWRALAVVIGWLLQMRLFIALLLVAYLVGWILGAVYARGF